MTQIHKGVVPLSPQEIEGVEIRTIMIVVPFVLLSVVFAALGDTKMLVLLD